MVVLWDFNVNQKKIIETRLNPQESTPSSLTFFADENHRVIPCKPNRYYPPPFWATNVDITNLHGLFHTLGIPVSGDLGLGFLAGFVRTR
jgi:hypothetical protein